MLPILAPFLKSKRDPTADDCRTALEVVKGGLDSTRERLGDLRAKRADALINGVAFREIDLIDTDVRHVNVDRQRLKITRDLLRGMITEAEAKARAAEADAILRQAVAMKSRGLDLVTAYSMHAGRLLEVLTELEQTEAAIANANAALAARGDPRSVPSIEMAYWGGREPGIQTFPPWSLLSQTRLPDPEVSRRLLWPREGQA